MQTFIRLSIFPLVIFLLALQDQNRSFVLGALCAWVLLMAVIYKPTRKIKVIAMFGIFVALAVLFWLKLDSSLGRLLIYKISFSIFQDHWLTGIGYGNLGKTYLNEQAAYFAYQPYTEKELLLADNTHYVFNEYYRLLIELGVGILIPLVILFVVLIRLTIQAISTRQSFAYLFASVLISILVASLFSNTFSKSFYWYLWVLQSAISLWLIKLNKNKACLYGNILLTLLTIFAAVSIYKTKQELTNLKYEVRSGEYEVLEIVQRFEKLKPSWYTDPVPILQIQSEFYMQQEEWDKAKQSVESLIHQKPFHLSYAQLGQIYEKLNNKKLAEYYYLKAVYAVPNRFLTRVRLFDFYLKERKYDKAKERGEEIMKLPIKVPSNLVEDIRNKVQYKLNEL